MYVLTNVHMLVYVHICGNLLLPNIYQIIVGKNEEICLVSVQKSLKDTFCNEHNSNNKCPMLGCTCTGIPV